LHQLADAFADRAKQLMPGMSLSEWGTFETVRDKMKKYAGTVYVIESFFLPANSRANLSGFEVTASLKSAIGPDANPYDWTIEKAMNLLSRISAPHVRDALRRLGDRGLRFDGPVDRSGYIVGSGVIEMRSTGGPHIVAHEVGHALEDAIPQLRQAVLDYYRQATHNSQPKHVGGEIIRPRTDGRNWPDLPAGTWDHVPRPLRYMGRDYGGHGTEISSLVLQAIFEGKTADIRELLENAPDLVEIVLRHLR
jgi:hypothetical protein